MLTTVGIVLMCVGALIGLIASIMIIVAGFKEHWGWGLSMLLFPGIPQIMFLFLHWPEAKMSVFVSAGGALVMLSGAGALYPLMSDPDQMLQTFERYFDVSFDEATGEPSLVFKPLPATANALSDNTPQKDATEAVVAEPEPVVAPEIQDMVGKNISEMLELYGAPRMRMQTGGRSILIYSDWEVIADRQGTIISIEPEDS